MGNPAISNENIQLKEEILKNIKKEAISKKEFLILENKIISEIKKLSKEEETLLLNEIGDHTDLNEIGDRLISLSANLKTLRNKNIIE